jgi:hypothetical protein
VDEMKAKAEKERTLKAARKAAAGKDPSDSNGSNDGSPSDSGDSDRDPSPTEPVLDDTAPAPATDPAEDLTADQIQKAMMSDWSKGDKRVHVKNLCFPERRSGDISRHWMSPEWLATWSICWQRSPECH